MNPSGKRRLGHVTLLSAIALAYVLLAHRFWFVCDDAFISFRYGRHWAEGHGPRYNIGDEVPVEGYSNFLWVAFSALVESLGGDPVFWAPVASFLCGLALLWLLYVTLLRRLDHGRSVAVLSVLTLASFPPFAVWATGGLETMPFSLALWVTFERMVLHGPVAAGPRRGRLACGAVSGLTLSLLRIEGIAWAALIGLLSFLERLRRRSGRAGEAAAYFLIVGSGFALYYTWRYGYYQLPYPIPVYTKVAFGPEVLLRGFRYVAQFFLTFLTPFLLFLALWSVVRGPRKAGELSLALMTVSVPVYAMIVGGDWMTMGRFLVPGLAFQTVLFSGLLERVWGWGRAGRRLAPAMAAIVVIIGLLPAWDIHLMPQSVRARFRFMYSHPGSPSEVERWVTHSTEPLVWKEIGLALKDHAREGDSVVVGAIGAIGYYSGLHVYDRFGLVTREVALLPRGDGPLRSPGHDMKVSRGFFLDRHPTFLVFDVIAGPDLRDRVVEQAREWRSWGVGLWRRYVPDYVVLGNRDPGKAERLLLVYRAIEDDGTIPLEELDRPARRRVLAERAERLWGEFYRRVEDLPNLPRRGSVDTSRAEPGREDPQH